MSSHSASSTSASPHEVASADGTPIVYDLYENHSIDAVVIIPGFWRERRHPAILRLARLLGDRGYRVVACDLRGHGESGGTFGFNLHEHEDVAAVIGDLLARTRTTAVTLIGFSYGGAIAVSTAARHALPVRALLLISPVADFSRLSPHVNPFTIHRHLALGQALRKPRFAWRFARSPKLSALDDIAGVHAPLCLIHVKNDWLVDHGHSVLLYERASEPKELHVLDIPGNYHADRIFDVAGPRLEEIVARFVAETTRL